MKVLLVHNFYGSAAPSGENAVYEAERGLLRQHGHEVVEFTRHSDEIRGKGGLGTLRGALAVPWNPWMVRAVRREVVRFKPDVVHAHNTFPLLSPGVFYAMGRRCATVLTLHNYRLFCPAAIPMREGRPCTDCLDGRTVIPSLVHRCYRNSRLATLPLAVGVALHRALGTWTDRVDAFIALTRFQRDLMVAAGLPGDRVSVKPQFYADPPQPLPWEKRSQRVVSIGRLSEEKGVKVLLAAWLQWGRQCPELDIIGDGPLRQELQALSERSGLGDRIHFLGQLPFAKAQERLSQARLMVVPSLCFEGFPMVIREAFALGVPVAASNLGSLPCIVHEGENGILVEPGNVLAFYHALKTLWNDQKSLSKMGQNARMEFEEKYTADANHKILMEIYEKATLNCRKHSTGSFS